MRALERNGHWCITSTATRFRRRAKNYNTTFFYIKHASIGLDTLIMFQTTKIVLRGRDAQ